MKLNARMFFPILIILVLFLFSCEKAGNSIVSPTNSGSGPQYCGDHNGNNNHNGNGNGNTQPTFEINLISNPLLIDGKGQYIWIWTVTNTSASAKDADRNHGFNDDDHDCGDRDGDKDGDDDNDCYNGHRLNFWFITLGNVCTLSNVIQAGYSYDGVNYKYFKPTYRVENVIKDVYSLPVLKFPHGTFGNKPTYYKLILNAYFGEDPNSNCVIKYGSFRDLRIFEGIGSGGTTYPQQ
ncbi:MAG: hypothetical protein ABSG15_03365 [FCB group bacterium]